MRRFPGTAPSERCDVNTTDGQRNSTSKAIEIIDVPRTWQRFRELWSRPHPREANLQAYQSGRASFIPNLLPEQAMALSTDEVLAILRARLGAKLDVALDPRLTQPDDVPETLPPEIRSPVAGEPSGAWLRHTNMVGINVRTIGNHWNIVKYALTLPAAQDSIHILPIWEAGVVGSIYGISSWRLNDEFFSESLRAARPELCTTERQLRAVINILHAMGRCVGMDVIPHTDRFSEIVLCFPAYFEWLQRQGVRLVDHRENLHEDVQQIIFEYVVKHGPAVPLDGVPRTAEALFDHQLGEADRLRVLFGEPEDRSGREARRNGLVKHLHAHGYEPVPGTMAPPFRGIEVDARPEARIIDSQGMEWRDFRITRPTGMSRVFGPLARFKLYFNKQDNRHWEVDFDRPHKEVWDYVCDKYHQAQRRIGFDFMRGDMSHVQMRAGGVPDRIDDTYDILGRVKTYIQRDHGVRHFGYFAETFLPPRDVFTYGEEMDHLEASLADVTLGDLQSHPVGSEAFIAGLRYYRDLLETRGCAPCFTVITGDKDDPRWDPFYLWANELRLFCGFFLSDMPSYMSLGWRTRDVHTEPAPNEAYTKLYVFQESDGPKATSGPYVWGRNGHLFGHVTRLQLYLDARWEVLRGRRIRWLIAPDATTQSRIAAWTQADDHPDHLFVINMDGERDWPYFCLPCVPGVDPHQTRWTLDFSATDREILRDSSASDSDSDRRLIFNGVQYVLRGLPAGECRVYRLETRQLS